VVVARRGGAPWVAALALVPIVVLVVAVRIVRDSPAPSSVAPSASPTAARIFVDPVTIGPDLKVATESDKHRFTYAVGVRNHTSNDVVLDAVTLQPRTGLTVAYAAFVPIGDWGDVLNPDYTPSISADPRLLRSGAEANFLLRVTVDCAAPPRLYAIGLRLRQDSTTSEQVFFPDAVGPGGEDVPALPAKVCG